MERTYEDSPIDIENWIETLSDKERILFDKGYTIALLGILEHIVEIKQTLLNTTLGLSPKQLSYKRQLLSRVHILDVLEKHYRKRVKVLEPTYK